MLVANKHIFHSSVIRGGSFLSGDTIEINGNDITLKRNHLFLKDFYSISIPLVNIRSVEVIRGKSGAGILIESETRNMIMSKGYRYSSACRMRQLLLQ